MQMNVATVTSVEPTIAPSGIPMTNVPPALRRLQAIEAEMAALLLGRDDAVRAALLAVLARQHLVLLGPPGTAKSLLIELLSERIAAPTGGGRDEPQSCSCMTVATGTGDTRQRAATATARLARAARRRRARTRLVRRRTEESRMTDAPLIARAARRRRVDRRRRL